jgi:hypothetical protein
MKAIRALFVALIAIGQPALADEAPSLFYEPPVQAYEAPTFSYEPPRIAPLPDPARALPPSQAYVERCTTRYAGYDPETNSTLDAEGNRVACAVTPQREN